MPEGSLWGVGGKVCGGVGGDVCWGYTAYAGCAVLVVIPVKFGTAHG